MIQRPLVLFIIVCAFSGCATVDNIAPDKKVVVVSAIDPTMQGQKVGLTIFNNKQWIASDPGFGVNEIVLKAVKADLNRDVKLVDGKEINLIVKNEQNTGSVISLAFAYSQPELAQKLAALGKDWQADIILIIQAASTQDWIGGTSAQLDGFGQYSRLASDRLPTFTYGYFWMRIFDCKTGNFAGVIDVKNAQQLPGIKWHDNWQDYTPGERRAIQRGVKAVIGRNVPILLSSLGLTNIKTDRLVQFKPGSFASEGNEIELPADVSKSAAHEAIVKGLADAGWNLASNTDDKLVGVINNGKEETDCSFSLTDHSAVLALQGYSNQDDGKRLPADYDEGSVTKLKKSIVTELLKAPAESFARPSAAN